MTAAEIAVLVSDIGDDGKTRILDFLAAGRSTGVRTLGLVCLGSALAVLSLHAVTGADASRVIQGIVTGVGFLGAGVNIEARKAITCTGSPRRPASG